MSSVIKKEMSRLKWEINELRKSIKIDNPNMKKIHKGNLSIRVTHYNKLAKLIGEPFIIE